MNKLKNRIAMAAATSAMMSLALPAIALEGAYVGGAVGYNKTDDQKFDYAGESTVVAQPSGVLQLPLLPNSGIAATSEYKDAEMFQVLLGYSFASGLRPEFELAYRKSKPDDILGSQGQSLDTAGVKLTTTSGMANLWYDFFPSWSIHPYVGGGVGFARFKLNRQPTDRVTIGPTTTVPVADICAAQSCEGPRKADDASLAYQLGAGIRWDVLDYLAVGLDYRYVVAGDAQFYNFKDQPETYLESDYKAQSLLLSANYYFDRPAPVAPAPVAPVAVTAPAAPVDTDGDGVPDDIDKCPGTAAGVQVDDKGCPLPPPCKSPEPGQKVDLSGCATGASIVLRGVNFEFDQSRLTPNAEVILDGVADSLSAYPTIKVELGGHTDSLGSDGYNERLSQRRADAVVAYLSAKGVAAERMTAMGYGETVPVSENETEEGRELNRRVEMKVTSGAAEAGVSVSDGTSAPAAASVDAAPAAAPEAAPADPVATAPVAEPAAAEPAAAESAEPLAAPADDAALTP